MPFRFLIAFIAVLAVLPCAFAGDDHLFANDSEWEFLSEGHQFAEGMAWDSEGHFYFTDVPRSQLFKIDKSTGRKTLVVADTGKANGIAFGPDGRLYGCSSEADGITAWNVSTWKKEVYGLGAKSNDLAILDDGSIYFTDPRSNSIWRIDGESRQRTLAIQLDFRPNGIALSPNKRSLFVASFLADTIYAWSIDESGQLKGDASIAYVLDVPSDGKGKLDGMQVLPGGRLVAGTALGIQVAAPFDQEKKSRPIIHHPHPENGPRCNYVRISPDGKWLYACFVNDVRRRLISAEVNQKAAPQGELKEEAKVAPESHTILKNHCYDCHDGDTQEGEVNLYKLSELARDARLDLLNRMEEQVYLSQMPPEEMQQPTAAERKQFLAWISQSFDSLETKSEFREKLHEPEYGNYVDHERLFSGEIKDEPFSPSRRWLVSPYIFSNKLRDTFGISDGSMGIINPINLPDVSGVRDYGNKVLSGDQFITMLSNAKAISAFQLGLVDVEVSRKQRVLAKPFAVILKQQSPPGKDEMEAAIRYQYSLVYDRKPSRVEMAGCLKLMSLSAAESGTAESLRKMLEAVILQPDFLYRNERGAGPVDEFGRQKLSPKDAAYAIAYALTDRRPDQQLLDAAESGRLTTKEDYSRQAKRLLQAKLGKQQIDLRISSNRSPSHFTTQVTKLRFFREFFGYSKAYQIFKDDKRLEGGTNTRGEHAETIKLLINEADLLVDRILERDEDVIHQLLTTDQFYLSHNGDNQMALKVSEKRRKDFDQLLDDYHKMNIKQFAKMHEREIDLYFDIKTRRNFDENKIKAIKAFMSAIPKAPDHKPVVFSTALNGRLKKPMRGGHYARNRVNLFNFDHVTWSYETQQPFKISNRMGILTHPAWLTAHSLNVSTNPVVRGKWVREKLLAGFIPDVPITVDAAIPDDPNRTLRQRLHEKTRHASCWRCHESMNPLGYAFEMYNDLGRFRTEEEFEYPEHLISEAPDIGPYTRNTYKKVALDTTGYLSGTGDETLDGEVENALDLIARLAKSDRVRQSIIRHAFRYFMGRNEMLSDSQTMIDADKAYLASNGSFNAVIVSLLSSDSFMYRKVLQE